MCPSQNRCTVPGAGIYVTELQHSLRVLPQLPAAETAPVEFPRASDPLLSAPTTFTAALCILHFSIRASQCLAPKGTQMFINKSMQELKMAKLSPGFYIHWKTTWFCLPLFHIRNYQTWVSASKDNFKRSKEIGCPGGQPLNQEIQHTWHHLAKQYLRSSRAPTSTASWINYTPSWGS